jgi:hypothetical protein
MTMSSPLALPALALALSTLSEGSRQDAACSSSQRRAALREMQSVVLKAAPLSIPSMAAAIAPGGALAGWRLSHGYVVLDGAGAIVLDNIEAVAPMPPILIYTPSDTSTASDWRDFDGPDDPYRLAGWSYFSPYTPGSRSSCGIRGSGTSMSGAAPTARPRSPSGTRTSAAAGSCSRTPRSSGSAMVGQSSG